MQVKRYPNVIAVDYVQHYVRHIVLLHVPVGVMRIVPQRVKICVDNHLAQKSVQIPAETIVLAVVKALVQGPPLVHVKNAQIIVRIHVQADAKMLVQLHVGKHAKGDVRVLVMVDVTILAKVDVPLLAQEVVRHHVEVNVVKTVGVLVLVVVSVMECLVKLNRDLH